MNTNLNMCCNNCGKNNHLYYQCSLPIISYGMIVFKYDDDKLKFLMVRRKNSFGYIDFVRGKYTINNIYQLQNIIDEMSLEEKEKILKIESFNDLWIEMWGINNQNNKNEKIISSKNFELIKEGILINEKKITLKDLVEKSLTKWNETEWEFPKGKRNCNEKDLTCALREFEEETGILQQKLFLIENVIPFEEIFIGTNYKSYKYKYFLAYIKEETKLDFFQKSEISKLEWKTIDKCLESIRPYNLEKKKIIKNINKVLEEYRLYL